ncbi:HET-domain-containing protein [Hypoxylon sp. NC0597]|nr:HET-domain-containing protein [Hypoxylon sp. NC0597]
MASIPGPVDFKDEIEVNLVTCVELLGNNRFLPANHIERLTTRQNIEIVLTAYGVPLSDSLVNFIQGKATRVFLVLVYIQDVRSILDFKSHGFCDEHLPIFLGRSESTRNRRIVQSLDEDSRQPRPQHWGCFSNWEIRDLEYFTDKQWYFLAPVFQDQNFHQRLDSRRPLPFIDVNEHSQGRFSTVHRVDIPGMHLGYGGDRNIVVAVKKFNLNDREYFQKEVGLLKGIHDLDHDHLIKPLTAFENGINQCVLFPWCDGGNLRDYWGRHHEHPTTAHVISWTMQQMAGLCDCLKWLWDRNFRHGDLKPENILHKGGEGNFLIADVGISRIHDEITEKRNKSTSSRYATSRYEAPEFRTNHGKHIALSRDFDTWSMGALLLEWLVWLSKYPGRLTLQAVKQFWQEDEQEQMRVDPRCQKLMKEMSNMMNANNANHCLKHLLDLVQRRLLVVQLAKGGEPLESGRAKAPELSERMSEIATSGSFSREPIIWETVGIAQGLPERLYPSEDNSTTMEDSFSSQRLTPLRPRPDMYDEVGKQVDDIWKSWPDNDFGRRILNDFGRGFLKTVSSRVALCDSCEITDILFSGSQIPYNMSSLIVKSRTCNLCALIRQCLLDVGIKSTGDGRLINKHSMIMDEATNTPLISIYRDLESKLDMSQFSQLGFPQLPKPGSWEQLKWIRDWLFNCDQDHECKRPPSLIGKSRMPTRLLDVGTGTRPTIRLVNTSGLLDCAYTALSHCWGEVPENLQFFTTRDNIRSHEEGIDFNRLPKTFQDAITVTRGIGIQYLWIDSLCIIQQDKEDWGINAGKMGTVFGSAYCTIAASSASSYLEGFIHNRTDRLCVAIQKGDRKLYLCKYIDNFHHDVEQAVLNKRGWVLQERALSRRTIHFTSNQVYLECGDGVQCETLARLHNSKAEFLGDPNFPKSALQYFRDGRIVLFQALYEMYSKLAFTVPTDRSVGIIGLERRLAKTFQTRSDYGVLECYSGRSLIWKRKCPDKLERIEYGDDCTVPSWSWMAYSGEISYVSAPFGGVSWNKDQIHIPFGEDGRLRNSTQTLAGKPEPMITAPVTNVNMDAYGDEILQLLIFDEVAVDDPNTIRCVVLGNDKEGDQDTRRYYVIAIQHCYEAYPKHVYKRVGAGSLLERHISTVSGEYISIR